MQDVRRILNKATESATKNRKSSGAAKRYLEHTKKTLGQVSKNMERVTTGLEKEINDTVESSINLVGLLMTQCIELRLTLIAAQDTDRTAQRRHGKGQRVQAANKKCQYSKSQSVYSECRW